MSTLEEKVQAMENAMRASHDISRKLHSENERLKTERDELKRVVELLESKYIDIDVLQSRVSELEAALEFYANPDSWESTTIDSTRDGCGCSDFSIMKFAYGSAPMQIGGRRAREALKPSDANKPEGEK